MTRKKSGGVKYSLTSIGLMFLLFPLTLKVYDLTWRIDPVIADCFFFGIWACSLVLAVTAILKSEIRTIAVMSGIFTYLPFLFIMTD